jgi:hypothetical protein
LEFNSYPRGVYFTIGYKVINRPFCFIDWYRKTDSLRAFAIDGAVDADQLSIDVKEGAPLLPD